MPRNLFGSRLFAAVVVLVAASALLWVGCSTDQSSITAPTDNITLLKLRPDQELNIVRAVGIQNKHTDRLLDLDGVVATAVGIGTDGNLAVKVYTKHAGVSGIPSTLDGLPVEIEESGEFRAFALTGRYRPVPIGVSTGNANECVAGTIGCVVYKGGQKYMLSNNHVLARENAASIGEDIYQPGRYDAKPICTNKPADKVADLSDFEPIKFGGANNTMDAAIALYSISDVTCATPSAYYGFPSATVVSPTVGLAIKKVGRTTSLTSGTITAINWTGNVGYSGGTAKFVGQFVTSKKMSKSGDSGSLVVTSSGNNPVGLLFAGTRDGTSICSPIGPILQRFNATICSN
ncbi:MAG: hypothetical protein AB1792_08175 [Candidatus Zixiibacteriota bacterium]